MRHGDALGAAVALVGDEPVDFIPTPTLTQIPTVVLPLTLNRNPNPNQVDALCLRYDATGEQVSHSVERLHFAELVTLQQ